MLSTFRFCSDSKDEKPGLIDGEIVTEDFSELECVPNWRRKLSNSWIQPFKHQDLIWNSVEHYYQASKFKKYYDFYYQFSINSGSDLSKDPEIAKKMGDKNVIDPDFFTFRAETEMADAMFAKFVKNKDLHDMLLFTKNAVLIHADTSVIFYNLMKIRETIKCFNYYKNDILINKINEKLESIEPMEQIVENVIKPIEPIEPMEEIVENVIEKLEQLNVTILFKKGDILNATEEYIVHLCNVTGNRSCNSITKKFPNSNIYSGKYKVSVRKPGTVVICENVINIIGQIHPGKHNTTDDTPEMRLSFFEEALKQIKNAKSIAFNYGIGCGIYGGKWEKYLKLIKKFSESNPDTVIAIYKI